VSETSQEFMRRRLNEVAILIIGNMVTLTPFEAVTSTDKLRQILVNCRKRA
jgi:hypothetical protein